MNANFVALSSLSEQISKRTDAILAAFVVGVVFMMIMPLPTWLVDSLIALNISLSALVVVLALYLPGPLAFSTFPAFLLITTLFRLALSITTTRLILLQGDAGEIVETFGEFVVGGNLVVGLVIFVILILVNFMVITKGSERVAEVSARFTLDAMPGKQMSIDSDLRAGLLTELEAKDKRKYLAKESALFGAMDGAMKFVKGDAVAGIIIVLVNILGGFSIGVMQQGLSGPEAIKLYSILTIGDGLVAQIPALLIALTSGMIITRVKDDVLDKSNVGQDMSTELVSEPKAWLIASLVLIAFSLIPGMPTGSFWFLAAIIAAVGSAKIYMANTEKDLDAKIVTQQKEQEVAMEAGVQDASSFDIFEQVCMYLHSDYENSPIFEEILTAIRKERNNVIINHGYMLPPLRYRFSNKLALDEYVLRFYETEEVKSTITTCDIAVEKKHAEKLDEISIEYRQGDPLRGEGDYLWVNVADNPQLAKHEISVTSCLDIIATQTSKAFLRKGYQFMGIDDAGKVFKWLENSAPEVKNELERLVPVSLLARVLKNLLRESVSLKSLRKIVETIITHADSERDPDVLSEHVRVALKAQICDQVARNRDLNICLLEPELEDLLRDSLRQTASGSFFTIADDDLDRFMGDLRYEVEESNRESGKSIALVVAQDLRQHIRRVIEDTMFDLPVLSYAELSPNIEVTPLARLSLN